MIIKEYPKSNIHENVQMPDEDFHVWAFYYENTSIGEPIGVYAAGLFSEHWHEYFELINILEGSMEVECGGRQITAKAGDTLIFNPSEIHSCYKIETPLKLYCVIFDVDILKSRNFDKAEKKYLIPILQGDIIFENHVESSKKLTWLVKTICSEIKQSLLGYELAIKSYLLEIFVVLLREYLAATLTETERNHNLRNYMRISEILNHIEANYMNDINIDELALIAYISKYYLCRLFKKIVGRTITEHIHLVRITKAYELLINSDMPVTEIATEVGFSDVNYFGRIFRRTIGHSPSETRKLALANPSIMTNNFIRKKLNQ